MKMVKDKVSMPAIKELINGAN